HTGVAVGGPERGGLAGGRRQRDRVVRRRALTARSASRLPFPHPVLESNGSVPGGRAHARPPWHRSSRGLPLPGGTTPRQRRSGLAHSSVHHRGIGDDVVVVTLHGAVEGTAARDQP